MVQYGIMLFSVVQYGIMSLPVRSHIHVYVQVGYKEGGNGVDEIKLFMCCLNIVSV